LMWDFEHGEAAAPFDISYTLPSRCARELAEGSADIGIIPVAAYTTIPGLKILSDVAIASKRAVRSILLVSKVPLEQIRKVALDTSSMTSVALTKVLFTKFWGGNRVFSGANPDLEKMLDQHDAALLIGDPALQVDRSRYITHDLAEEWIRFTGKPFVFAFWAIRQGAIANIPSETDLAVIFQKSRDHGLEAANLESIVRHWAARLSLTEENVRQYLIENIHYYLDPARLEGLHLFYRYAQECGALPAAPSLAFLENPKSVVSER
ncbi:MAG: Chorismate dehydratase, partial [Acidobacteriaceae bacterium]|nr:Chorismate dehydratase [Acidobacteriaceae bacterium]